MLGRREVGLLVLGWTVAACGLGSAPAPTASPTAAQPTPVPATQEDAFAARLVDKVALELTLDRPVVVTCPTAVRAGVPSTFSSRWMVADALRAGPDVIGLRLVPTSGSTSVPTLGGTWSTDGRIHLSGQSDAEVLDVVARAEPGLQLPATLDPSANLVRLIQLGAGGTSCETRWSVGSGTIAAPTPSP